MTARLKSRGKTEVKPKAGRSAAAMAARYVAFANAYLINGHNATAAAKAAGCAGRQLGNAGWKLLQRPEVQQILAERGRQVAKQAAMDTATWGTELTALAFSRLGNLIGPDGRLVPIHLLPAHVQASIASVKVRDNGAIEYKFWNKPAALEIMARHLGLFEKDNTQQQSDIRVRVELLG